MYFNYLENRKTDESVQGKPAEFMPGQMRGRVEALLQVSQDANFTQYLLQMRERIANQERQMKLLADELESRVQMYENNQRARAQAGGARPVGQQSVQPMPPQQPVQQNAQQVPPQQPAQPNVQQMSPVQPMPQQQPVQQMLPQQNVQQVPPQPAQSNRNVEFTIGAAVLSIVGSIFILTAMVMLGIYFMQGLTKGLLLYAVCAVVMLLSELLLYRRWPKLGMTFSAVGMGGLYISTLTNYLALKNFNQWVALGITLAITVGVIVLSRKRDAVSYRILGMAAMYVSVFEILNMRSAGGVSQAEWVTTTIMVFIINVMCLAVPVRKSHTNVNIVHMTLNVGFALSVYGNWGRESATAFGSVSEIWHYPLFIAMSILVMQMIYVAQLRWSEKQGTGSSMVDNAGICVVYCLSGLMYLPLVAQVTDLESMIAAGASTVGYGLGYRLACTGSLVLICLVPILALRKRTEKWFAWYLLNLMALVIHLKGAGEWEFCICLSILLAASKLLSFGKSEMVRNGDAALTTLACMIVFMNRESAHVIPLSVVLLLGVLCVNYWHVYFETILTLTLAYYVAGYMLSGLRLPVFVGILFVGMLAFNNVKRWNGKAIEIYNALMLVCQTLCYLMLLEPVYRNAYLTYLCMLIFGVATIIICFPKKYHMDFDGKQLVLAGFLTYMGLIVRIGSPIINSILLMLIALACVGAGFVINKKSVRIYGLVLSLAVCVKIVLYDFMEAEILQRTILFFAVGVLALIISAIYMILERNQEKKDLSNI